MNQSARQLLYPSSLAPTERLSLSTCLAGEHFPVNKQADKTDGDNEDDTED